ncbi:hypothetical protein CBS101457_001359 [Exobasidium rhododendri]|nr:hypothetical protein CBS101457_001359 [Exobasidium rhododendri]
MEASTSLWSGGPISLRRVELSNFRLEMDDLERLGEYIHGSASMSVLSMKACEILPSTFSVMHNLARSVNMSNLRVLELANNPIGTRSMVQLIDNLNTPCLIRLVLSMTVLKSNLHLDQLKNPLWQEGDQSWRNEPIDAVWNREIQKVGKSFANLISSNREGGHAPRLTMLLLSANDLGWKSVRKIVKAVLDGNRRLTAVELFATITSPSQVNIEGESDDDDDDEEEEAAAVPSLANELTRSSSSSDLYLRSKREKTNVQRDVNFTPPRASQASKSQFSPVERLTSTNWLHHLGRYLWANKIHRTAVKDSSRYILATARVLSCRCRQGEETNRDTNSTAIFPFTKLPPEIRRKIIGHLDDKALLSEEQMERIISFASDSTTLGFGSSSKSSGLSEEALRHISSKVRGTHSQEGYGLLPHRSWHWITREYSLPRDWPALMIDSSVSKATSGQEEDFPDIHGPGGGGPDGYGGSTYGQIGPDPARRRWLEEQSGLQAFWEIV